MTSGSFTISVATGSSATGTAPGTASAVGGNAPTNSNSFASSVQGTYGTGAGQVKAVVQQDRALAAGAAETLDLTNLTDILGQAVAFTDLRYVVVRVLANPDGSATSGGLTLAPGASNPHPLFFGSAAYPAKPVRAGGPGFVDGDPAGVAVSGGARTVLVTNADGTNALTYRVELAGQA